MFDDSKVTFEVEVCEDDTEIRGNVIASGDDDFDRGVEEEILERLDNGDVWAWASVCVVACYDGLENVRGNDYLYCCNCANEADFKTSIYYAAMCDAAKRDLFAKLKNMADRLGLDVLIDPYEGDPRNEVADLADSVWFANDRAYAEYEGEGLSMRLHGTVGRVLTVLRAAHGRD